MELPSVFDVVGSPPLHESPEPFVDAFSRPVSRLSVEEAGADDTLLEARRFDDLFVPGERASGGSTDAPRDREPVDLVIPPLPSSALIAAPALAPATDPSVASPGDTVIATGAYSAPSSALPSLLSAPDPSLAESNRVLARKGGKWTDDPPPSSESNPLVLLPPPLSGHFLVASAL